MIFIRHEGWIMNHDSDIKPWMKVFTFTLEFVAPQLLMDKLSV